MQAFPDKPLKFQIRTFETLTNSAPTHGKYLCESTKSLWNSAVKLKHLILKASESNRLITLEVDPFCTHAHLLQRFCHAWKHSWESSFVTACSPAVPLHFISWTLAKI